MFVGDQTDGSPLLISSDQRSETAQAHSRGISQISNTTLEGEEAPARYRDLTDIYNACSFALTAVDPTTFEEAVKNEDWVAAIKEKMAAIYKNKTWELTTLPERRNAIGLEWVFKSKFNPNGTLLKKKVRVVAKGYV